MWVRTRGNLQPIAARSRRGASRAMRSTQCDAGCTGPETLANISQTCPRTHGARIKRHDKVAKYAAHRLKTLRFEVEEEKIMATSEGERKPDVIARKDGRTVVVDAQVLAHNADLEEQHRLKAKKYDMEELKRQLNAPAEDGTYPDYHSTAITMNWRGGWAETSAVDLRRLGFTYRSRPGNNDCPLT